MLLGQKFFVRFLGELNKSKSLFEINLPLVKFKKHNYLSAGLLRVAAKSGVAEGCDISFCCTLARPQGASRFPKEVWP